MGKTYYKFKSKFSIALLWRPMKTISKTNFKTSVNKLIKDDPRKVVGIKSKGEKFVFEDLNSADELRLDYDVSLYPPKKYFLPQKETLMKYDLTKGYQLKEVNEVEPLIMIGVHPYDIVALQQMDKVFQDGNADQNYLKKREESVIIGVNMVNISPYSFAGSMNTAIIEEGFDLMLTDIGDSYAIEIGSKKGEQLLNGFSNVTDANDEDKEKVAEQLKISLSTLYRKLERHNLKVL